MYEPKQPLSTWWYERSIWPPSSPRIVVNRSNCLPGQSCWHFQLARSGKQGVKVIMDVPVPARPKSQYMVWISHQESLAHVVMLAKMHSHVPGVQTVRCSYHCSSASRWYLWSARFNASSCFVNIFCQMVCTEYSGMIKTTYPRILFDCVHHQEKAI